MEKEAPHKEAPNVSGPSANEDTAAASNADAANAVTAVSACAGAINTTTMPAPAPIPAASTGKACTDFVDARARAAAASQQIGCTPYSMISKVARACGTPYVAMARPYLTAAFFCDRTKELVTLVHSIDPLTMTWGDLVERLVATKAMRTSPRRAGLRIYHYKHQPTEAKQNDAAEASPSPLPGLHDVHVVRAGAPPPWRGLEVDPPSPNVTLAAMWLGYWGMNSSTLPQHPVASLNGPEGDRLMDSYEPTKEELEVLLFPPSAPASRFAPLLFVIAGCSEPEEASHQIATDVYFLRSQVRLFSADNVALRKEVADLKRSVANAHSAVVDLSRDVQYVTAMLRAFIQNSPQPPPPHVETKPKRRTALAAAAPAAAAGGGTGKACGSDGGNPTAPITGEGSIGTLNGSLKDGAPEARAAFSFTAAAADAAAAGRTVRGVCARTACRTPACATSDGEDGSGGVSVGDLREGGAAATSSCTHVTPAEGDAHTAAGAAPTAAASDVTGAVVIYDGAVTARPAAGAVTAASAADAAAFAEEKPCMAATAAPLTSASGTAVVTVAASAATTTTAAVGSRVIVPSVAAINSPTASSSVATPTPAAPGLDAATVGPAASLSAPAVSVASSVAGAGTAHFSGQSSAKSLTVTDPKYNPFLSPTCTTAAKYNPFLSPTASGNTAAAPESFFASGSSVASQSEAPLSEEGSRREGLRKLRTTANIRKRY